tara:strand:+ start:2928 stop:3827 length:900 start_codon:yes stop_codon:yes gene_type:complete
MRNNNLIGTGVALVTPFKEDFSIDFNSLDKLIEHLINNGINYFVVMGTTGESATLSLEEQKAVLSHIKQTVNSRVPLVLGVGGNNTREVLDKMNDFDFSDIEAILSVCPYYNKPSQAGLFAHFSAIAEKAPVDVILYNVPSRTALNIHAETVVSLANKYPNIVAIKEASGDIAQCMDLIDKTPDDFMLISGDDKITFPIMSLGGVGVISVQAMAFPSIFSKMVDFSLKGDFELAKSCHYRLLKSVDMFYVDGNPSGVKEALYSINICASNQVRLPLVKMNSDNAQILRSLIKETIRNKK